MKVLLVAVTLCLIFIGVVTLCLLFVAISPRIFRKKSSQDIPVKKKKRNPRIKY